MTHRPTHKLLSIVLGIVVLVAVTLGNAAAALLSWDFTARVSSVRGDIGLLPSSVAIDDILQGTFAYQDDLTNTSPQNTSDYYEPVAPPAFFEVTIPTLTTRTEWDNYRVTVGHQTGRDIAEVMVDYYRDAGGGAYDNELMGLRTIDYSLALFPNGVLPTDWHIVPITSDFDFTYHFQTAQGEVVDVNADIQSVTLRATPVPAPATVLLLLSGLLCLITSRRMYLPHC